MPLPSNPDRKLDRKSVERIIQRAAELQAEDRDVGDGISESEMLSLGEEVGIPGHIMRRAMFDEQMRPLDHVARGVVPWLIGVSSVNAGRVMRRESTEVEKELAIWMAEKELLTLKRRFPERTSWEPRKDLLSSVKRALGFGGMKYQLTRVREVVVEVTRLEADTCHVALAADISNFRTQRGASAGAFFTTGGIASVVAVVLGFAIPVAMLPAGAGVASGILAARARHRDADKISVAMEQILDRLEHNELRESRKDLPPGGAATVNVLVDRFKERVDIISGKKKR